MYMLETAILRRFPKGIKIRCTVSGCLPEVGGCVAVIMAQEGQ